MSETEKKICSDGQKNQDSITSEKYDSTEKKSPEMKYPSAKLLLSVIQKENDIEIDRKKALETRAGIFMGFSGALLAFFTKNIDFSFFNNVNPSQFMLFASLFAILFLGPIILLLIGVYNFIRVIATKEYKRIGLGGFSEDIAQQLEDETALQLMEAYRDVVESNGKSNEDKTKFFRRGIFGISIATALMLIMYIISLNLSKGGV